LFLDTAKQALDFKIELHVFSVTKIWEIMGRIDKNNLNLLKYKKAAHRCFGELQIIIPIVLILVS